MIFKAIKLFLFITIFFIQNNFGQSLLWEISGDDLETSSYLFGTMHTQDKRAFEFNDSILVKIDQCAAFAPEINSEQTESFDEGAIFLEKGSIRDHVSKEDYELITKVVKDNLGMEMAFVERFLPVVLATMIMETRTNHDMPEMVDVYLEKYAAEKGLKILSVEKIEDQMKLLSTIPAESVVAYFRDLEAYDDYNEKMIELYRNEDPEGLLKLISSDKSFASVLNMLLDDRNVTMAENISKMSKVQPTFFAVGAGHLSGEKGLIQLLKNKGFSVEPIIAEKTNVLPELMPKTPEEWVVIAPENSGFSAEFPAKPTFETSTEETPIGNLEMNFFMHEAPDSDEAENFMYGVIFLDYPESFTELITSEEMKRDMFDGAAGGVIEETGGKLTREIEIEKNGVSGKEFDITFMGDLALMTIQIFMVKNRMYMVQVAGMAGGNDNSAAQRFLNSFTLK